MKPFTQHHFSPERFRRYARELSAAVFELSDEVKMGLPEVKKRLAHIPGINRLTVESTGRGDEIYRLGEVIAVVPRGNDRATMVYLEDKFSRPLRAEKIKAIMSAIDRIKRKALEAKGIVPAAIAEVEADLDWIIGQKEVITKKRGEATAPHKEAISGVMSELHGLHKALDILTNGGDPLDESETTEHGSNEGA